MILNHDFCLGYSRDIDIIRKCIYKTQDSVVESCTLEEELLPPAYRTEVQALIAQAKKSPNRKLKLKSVLDYYPFQR